MPRTKNAIPDAKKRCHRGSWEILWRWNGHQYTLAANVSGKAGEKTAEAVRRAVSSGLAGNGAFTPPYD